MMTISCWLRLPLVLGLCVLLSLGLVLGCRDSTLRSPEPEVLHLTFWHGINPPPNRDVFQKLVDKFNQTHPQIQVESLYIGQSDQQMPKVLTAVVGNASPDMLWFAPMMTGQLIDLDAIAPLDDWLNQSPVKSDIDSALLSGMELNGHLWSIPMATNNVGIFYRPKLFAEAGITQLPRTWRELRDAAEKLTLDKNGDGRTDQYGMLLPLGKGEWTVFTWLPFFFSAGGEVVKNNRAQIESPEAIAALQLWSDLLKDGSATLSAPERGYELDGFLSDRVAMQLTGPWTLGELAQKNADFGVMPMPALEKSSTVVGGENIFIMKTTPEREKASQVFLEYVLSEEFQTEFALGTGYLPINLKARQSKTYKDFVAQQPVLNVFLEQMSGAKSRPIITGYARISDQLGRAIESVLLGSDPRTALQASQTRLDLALNP